MTGTFKELFDRWSLSSLKLNLGFLSLEVNQNENDKDAAWELYVELITRITTQKLRDGTGDEATALDSVYSLFKTTRSILKEKGRRAPTFSKIAVVVLNQIIRPFTAFWHREGLQGAFQDPTKCEQFRDELSKLQTDLRNYSRLLAELAEVEDISAICENTDE